VERESFSSSCRRTVRCFDLVVLIILLFLFLLLLDTILRCYGVEFSFCSRGSGKVILFALAVDLQLLWMIQF
jgi:hypothetical protein